MSQLLLTLLLTASGPCFVASDPTPGWKHITLPIEASALAAPSGVDQFRSNELVTIIDHRSGMFLSGRDDGAGVTAFDFSFGEGARSLDVEFTAPLQGAKVDVWAHGDFGTMSLMREQRQGGSRLKITWGQTQVRSVVVRVHNHLRKQPVLLGWRSIRRMPSARLQTSEAFRLERSLYYRQPAGAAVLLCNDPDRELELRPDAVGLSDRPMPVLLKRP